MWRICIGVSLVPAFGTLYQRLTLPESKRFKEAQNMNADIEIVKEKEVVTSSSSDAEVEPELVRKAHFKGNQITSPHHRRLTCYQNS